MTDSTTQCTFWTPFRKLNISVQKVKISVQKVKQRAESKQDHSEQLAIIVNSAWIKSDEKFCCVDNNKFWTLLEAFDAFRTKIIVRSVNLQASNVHSCQCKSTRVARARPAAALTFVQESLAFSLRYVNNYFLLHVTWWSVLTSLHFTCFHYTLLEIMFSEWLAIVPNIICVNLW